VQQSGFMDSDGIPPKYKMVPLPLRLEIAVLELDPEVGEIINNPKSLTFQI